MSMEKGSDIMILRGTAMWASVCDGKPNDLSKKYQVDICNLSNEDSDKLKEAGIAVKNGADKGNFVIAKGAYPPKVMDSSKIPWDFARNGLIGNGSSIKVSCRPFDWTFKGKAGTSLGLNQLMVIAHVSYNDDLEAETDTVETDFDDEDEREVA